jgi:hypothetical protein
VARKPKPIKKAKNKAKPQKKLKLKGGAGRYAHIRHTISNLVIYEGPAQQNGEVDATKDVYIRGNCEPPYNAGDAYASVEDDSYYWSFSVDPSAVAGYDWEIYIAANTLAGYGKDFLCTINRISPRSTSAAIEFSIQ